MVEYPKLSKDRFSVYIGHDSFMYWFFEETKSGRSISRPLIIKSTFPKQKNLNPKKLGLDISNMPLLFKGKLFKYHTDLISTDDTECILCMQGPEKYLYRLETKSMNSAVTFHKECFLTVRSLIRKYQSEHPDLVLGSAI